VVLHITQDDPCTETQKHKEKKEICFVNNKKEKEASQ